MTGDYDAKHIFYLLEVEVAVSPLECLSSVNCDKYTLLNLCRKLHYDGNIIESNTHT